MPKPILEVTLAKVSTSWNIVPVRPPSARHQSKVCVRGWLIYQVLHLLCVLTVFAYTDEQRLVRPLSEYTCSRLITMEDTKLYRIAVDIRLWDFGSTFELLEAISIGLAVSLNVITYLVQEFDYLPKAEECLSRLGHCSVRCSKCVL